MQVFVGFDGLDESGSFQAGLGFPAFEQTGLGEDAKDDGAQATMLRSIIMKQRRRYPSSGYWWWKSTMAFLSWAVSQWSRGMAPLCSLALP